ncbi:MAG: formimidoylglutamase [Flavobacteriales bacterium]|nr:formimidoylglutamase [Flavobacteriales bacterium]
MDLSIFFKPVEENFEGGKHSFQKTFDIHTVNAGFPDLEDIDVAIIGVKEERGAIDNEGCSEGADEVRRFLYKLNIGGFFPRVVDLGNIKAGETINDTYFALTNSIEALIKRKILPIIIGGSQDLTFANYAAYQKMEQTVNLVSIDNQLDLGSSESGIDDTTYLSKIILHQPNFLFNFSNLGYQTYFVNQESIELMSKLFFDASRLGQISGNVHESEPIIRNADMLSFDVSAIRMADAPGCKQTSPNGFNSQEACQMARYAGISDKLSSIGFYNYNPTFDNRGQTAHLLAQMIWCVIEGYYQRKDDFPVRNSDEYLKYRVMLEDNKYELLFYKSKKSDRWWMDIPYPPNKRIQFERHHLVPCSYSHYEKALADEMPDSWWKTYQKLI